MGTSFLLAALSYFLTVGFPLAAQAKPGPEIPLPSLPLTDAVTRVTEELRTELAKDFRDKKELKAFCAEIIVQLIHYSDEYIDFERLGGPSPNAPKKLKEWS